MTPIVLTLVCSKERGTSAPWHIWDTPCPWLIARAFDAADPLPASEVRSLGAAALISLANDNRVYGVKETVDEIANLVDARRTT